MLGAKRNRIRAGFVECPYGCCRAGYAHKKRTRRAIRRIEKRNWKRNAQEG